MDAPEPTASLRVDPCVLPYAEHPGEHLRDVLADRKLTVHRLAEACGVCRHRISGVLAGRRAITADTSIRFGRALGMTPGFWLGLQVAFDLHTANAAGGYDAVELLPNHLPEVEE